MSARRGVGAVRRVLRPPALNVRISATERALLSRIAMRLIPLFVLSLSGSACVITTGPGVAGPGLAPTPAAPRVNTAPPAARPVNAAPPPAAVPVR